jgi:hypothetical protein
MPSPIKNNNEKQKIVTYYNIYGGNIIKTTYNPNTNTYHTKRSPFNVPSKLE